MTTSRDKAVKTMKKIDLKFYLLLRWKFALGKTNEKPKSKLVKIRSEIFLRSAGSSWSMNINLERVIEDRNLQDLQNTQLLESD